MSTFSRKRQCPKCKGEIYKGWLYCRNNSEGVLPILGSRNSSICRWKPK